jgi:hypothetical protein
MRPYFGTGACLPPPPYGAGEGFAWFRVFRFSCLMRLIGSSGVYRMPMTYFALGLIGVLTGRRLLAGALVLGSAVIFIATVAAALATGHSGWASLVAAFMLIFTLQIFYLLGLTFWVGGTEITRRFTIAIPKRKSLPQCY